MSNKNPTLAERIAAADAAANVQFAKFDREADRGNDHAARKALRDGRRWFALARRLEVMLQAEQS